MFGTSKGGRIIRVGPNESRAVVTSIYHEGATAGIATIAFRDGGVGVAAGGELAKGGTSIDNVIVTRDGGTTWTLGGHLPFPGGVWGIAYAPGRRGTIVAVSPEGSAWSGDDGATWHRLDDQSYRTVSVGSDGIGWMAGPGGRITKITFE